MAYALATSYAGESLLSGFNWFDGPDPSHGYVSYQSRPNAEAKGLFAVDDATGVVRLGVDSTNKYSLSEGRPSIRLESKMAYNHGLFVADFLHMPPSQCGLWPAFWSYGPDWPRGGEVDIIEGANDQYLNVISAHTSTGCRIADEDHSQSAGVLRSSNCDIGDNNVGCGYDSPANDTAAYGDGFNAANGGVYAMEWDSDFIKIWHFTRGQIPQDIAKKEPDPTYWGTPDATFGGSSCDVDKFFKDMNLVININFCGDWGNAIWGKTDGCGKYAPTCSEYVANNPQAFANAYWDVRYIDAYQKSDAPPPPQSSSSPPASSSTSPPFPTEGFQNRTSRAPTSKMAMTTSATRTASATSASQSANIDINNKYAAIPPFSSTPQTTAEPKNPLNVGDSALLGCYGSSDGFETFRKVLTDSDMTLERCVSACQGSMFAGVYDMQCFCADDLNANARAVDGSNGVCDHPCPGDKVEYCGGLTKMPGNSGPDDSPFPSSNSQPDENSYNNTSSPRPPTRYPPGAAQPSTGSNPAPFANVTKRFTFQRRAARPRNILLTVYGVVKNQQPPPLPPPMAPGNNITYTVTSTQVQTISCTKCTKTAIVVPVQQTPSPPNKTKVAAADAQMSSLPSSSPSAPPMPQITKLGEPAAYETVRLVETVTETCDSQTSSPTSAVSLPSQSAPSNAPARPAVVIAGADGSWSSTRLPLTLAMVVFALALLV